MIWEEISGFLQDYGTPVALAAHGASVLAKEAANRRVLKEQSRLAQAELERQRALGQQARARYQAIMPTFSPQAQEASRAAEVERLNRMNAPATTASPVIQNYQQATATAPQVVQGDIARAVGEALQAGQDQARRSAIARSFGSVAQRNAFELDAAGRDISRVGRDARRSSEVLPLELEEANLKGHNLRTLSSLLGFGGDVAGYSRIFRRPKSPGPVMVP